MTTTIFTLDNFSKRRFGNIPPRSYLHNFIYVYYSRLVPFDFINLLFLTEKKILEKINPDECLLRLAAIFHHQFKVYGIHWIVLLEENDCIVYSELCLVQAACF